MAIGIDHGSYPDFPFGQPLLDGILIGVCDYILRQSIGNLDGQPLTGMMAAQEEYLAGAAATLANAQRPNRTVLYTAPELSELHDLGLAGSQLTHVLLQARRGMIAGDGFLRSERRHIGVRQVQLFNAVAHALQSLGLRLGRAQNYVVRFDLPYVQPQWQFEQLRQGDLRI